jgi:branched-subunit amino acid aminotransferase/4-amino-4-deoxychorismate lyase
MVTGDGSRRVALPYTPDSLHDLPPWLPLGVYTSLRTFEHNKFLRLSGHLQRLEQSMALQDWHYILDVGALRRALQQVCTVYEHPDARVRIDVLPHPAPQLDSDSRLLLTLAPFEPPPPAVYEQGVSVGLAPQLHRLRPRAKTADFVLARRKIALNQAYEVLLLDEEGCLLEGSSSNFYAVSDGAVLTAGDGVLEGITRSIILQLVEEAGITLHLRAPRLSETAQLDEAFLSSSSRGLVPVRQIAAQVVGSGGPGPVTRRLMADYEQFVAQAIRPAVPAL